MDVKGDRFNLPGQKPENRASAADIKGKPVNEGIPIDELLKDTEFEAAMAQQLQKLHDKCPSKAPSDKQVYLKFHDVYDQRQAFLRIKRQDLIRLDDGLFEVWDRLKDSRSTARFNGDQYRYIGIANNKMYYYQNTKNPNKLIASTTLPDDSAVEIDLRNFNNTDDSSVRFENHDDFFVLDIVMNDQNLPKVESFTRHFKDSSGLSYESAFRSRTEHSNVS